MAFFWVLVLLFVVVLVGIGVFVFGTLFGRERQLLNEAEEKIERGREAEAVSILSRITDLNPANFKARWRLAKLLQTMGQQGAAAYHYEYCLENDGLPRYVRPRDALVRLAEVYEQQGHYEEAADTWTRFLQQEPDSTKGYFRRGKAFYHAGAQERALADFRTIRSDYPEEEPPQTALFMARCFRREEVFDKSLEYYREYLDKRTGDIEALIEAARVARVREQFGEARTWYEEVRDRGSDNQYAEATIKLIEMEFDRDRPEAVRDRLDELRAMKEDDRLTWNQILHYRYLRAQLLEAEDRRDEAVDIYWDLYENNPNFRDLPSIIEEEIGRMDPDDLLGAFMDCDRQRFVEQCEELVRLMGFEVMKTDAYSPYEVDVSAREDASGVEADRVLVTVKRWESEVGEWPIREFELSLLEDRYDRGVFVAPHGFKPRAQDFADDSPVRLIGPETLIEYLREVHKQIQ